MIKRRERVDGRRNDQRTEELIKFIRAFRDRNGYVPSYQEMKRGIRASSTCVVSHHLHKLARQGRIIAPGKRARAIRVVE